MKNCLPKYWFLIIGLLGIHLSINAQPGPYLYCKMFFSIEAHTKKTNLIFPDFTTIGDFDIGIDKRNQMVLIVEGKRKHLSFVMRSASSHEERTSNTFKIDPWHGALRGVFNLYLFPIPAQQRNQKTITVSSHYVTHLKIKVHQENKWGDVHHEYKMNIPYKAGSYLLDFFAVNGGYKKIHEAPKLWKVKKHPNKMYTFKIRE